MVAVVVERANALAQATDVRVTCAMPTTVRTRGGAKVKSVRPFPDLPPRSRVYLLWTAGRNGDPTRRPSLADGRSICMRASVSICGIWGDTSTRSDDGGCNVPVEGNACPSNHHARETDGWSSFVRPVLKRDIYLRPYRSDLSTVLPDSSLGRFGAAASFRLMLLLLVTRNSSIPNPRASASIIPP